MYAETSRTSEKPLISNGFHSIFFANGKAKPGGGFQHIAPALRGSVGQCEPARILPRFASSYALFSTRDSRRRALQLNTCSPSPLPTCLSATSVRILPSMGYLLLQQTTRYVAVIPTSRKSQLVPDSFVHFLVYCILILVRTDFHLFYSAQSLHYFQM